MKAGNIRKQLPRTPVICKGRAAHSSTVAYSTMFNATLAASAATASNALLQCPETESQTESEQDNTY